MDWTSGMRRWYLVILLLAAFASCKSPDKIDQLLSQMTLEEKCGQLTCPIGFNLYGKDGDDDKQRYDDESYLSYHRHVRSLFRARLGAG